MPKATTQHKVQLEQDSEILKTAPEVSVFIHCLVMVNQLRALERSYKHEDINRGAFLDKSNAVLGQFNKAVAATERFDIVFPVIDYGRFSPFFWRWFNWWDDYFKCLTAIQITEIERLARERFPGVQTFRPKADWVEYRQNPAFTLVPA
jgi:hypothetical protein